MGPHKGKQRRVRAAGSDVSELCIICRRTLTKKIYSQDDDNDDVQLQAIENEEATATTPALPGKSFVVYLN